MTSVHLDTVAERDQLKSHCLFLSAMNQRLRDENYVLQSYLRQVDDVLTSDWIAVKNNDYRKALNDLIHYNIKLAGFFDNEQLQDLCNQEDYND